jgi:hypothetical protein
VRVILHYEPKLINLQLPWPSYSGKYIDAYIPTSGDENHLCGASLRESHKIYHAHGIDYHHMHQRHGAGTPEYSSMSVSDMIQLHDDSGLSIGLVPV